MGIGAIIGIAASLYQAVQSYNRTDAAASKSDQLFSQLDAQGKGAIEGSDLQTAFDKIATQATLKADQLFTKLDGDGNGQVTKEEFSGSINRLAQELDDYYTRMRTQVDTTGNAGFTRDQLTNSAASIASSFDQADSDRDGRLTVKEAVNYGQASSGGTAAQSTSASDGQNVELMLQVMRLMQAYGAGGSEGAGANARSTKIATSA